MCGCFVLLIGLAFPRLALALMALFNDEITRAFDGSWVVPLIGWFLLPYSTLTFVLVNWYAGSVEGFYWLFVMLAFLLDMGSWFGGWGRRQTVYRYYESPPPAPRNY